MEHDSADLRGTPVVDLLRPHLPVQERGPWAWLADRMGITRSAVSEWLRLDDGMGRVPLKRVRALGALLGLPEPVVGELRRRAGEMDLAVQEEASHG